MRLPWHRKWKPVSVLTGFLGSGKTTILQHLLTLPAMKRTALIINEFGEVSVDHLLVENAEEKMVLLSNGCVCCSVRGDLVQAIRSLFARLRNDEIPPFDRVLLETTGLADPGPIVQSLIGPALRQYPVYFDSIATTVDASNALQAIVDNPQMKPQIAVADSLMVTKTDLCRAEQVDEVVELTRTLNPRATLERIEGGRAQVRSVFGQHLLDPTASPRELRGSVAGIFADGDSDSPGDVHKGIQSFVITRDVPLSYATLDGFLRALCGYRGQDLLRVKGLVCIRGAENRPTVVHGVQALMHPPTRLKRWPTQDRRTQLVFITRDIGRTDVEKLLVGIETGFR